jgi:primosomal protein N' (replication factor Y) (superfamily II helicase)
MAEAELFEEPIEVTTLFVEVLLPVPIPKLFTYRVPKALNEIVKIGQRVIVQFGKKKIYTGIIFTLHQKPPQDYEAKYILEILDEAEVIYPQQFKLYQWIADYYLCTMGEVMIAALPSGLKLTSESMVQINPTFDPDHTEFEFSEKEWALLHRLKKEALSYSEVAKFFHSKNIYSLIRSLNSKSAIIIYEEVKGKFKPKTERRIRLSSEYLPKKKLESLFEIMANRPKQEAILLHYLKSVPVFTHAELNQRGVPRSEFTTKEFSLPSFKILIKEKIMEEFELVVPRFGFEDAEKQVPLLLSEKPRARSQSTDEGAG